GSMRERIALLRRRSTTPQRLFSVDRKGKIDGGDDPTVPRAETACPFQGDRETNVAGDRREDLPHDRDHRRRKDGRGTARRAAGQGPRTAGRPCRGTARGTRRGTA